MQSLDVSIIYEVFDDLDDSPDLLDYPKPSLGVVSQQHSGSVGSYSSNASDSIKVSYICMLYRDCYVINLFLFAVQRDRTQTYIYKYKYINGLCITQHW